MNEKKFQKNLQYWSHTAPKYAVLLPNIDCSDLIFCQTKKGELNLQKKFEGKWHCYHSNEGALQEANEWFTHLQLEKIEVLYVYGVGLGYYYQAAKQWLQKKNSHFLVFLEDDLAVIHRLFETDLGTEILQNPQVQLHYFHDLHHSEEIFELLYWNFVMTEFKVEALNLYAQTKSDLFSQVQYKIFYDASIKNALLDEYLKYGAAFFKNFYPNILCLADSYLGNHLFGKFEKIPAIICGAGPSLEKQLPLLAKQLDKALIFAGGSSLNALNAVNMLPHFGAGIDPNSAQFDRLNANQAFEVPFFYRNRMFHGAFRLIHGPRLYVTGTGGYRISDWFEERLNIQGEFLDEGHNVVNFCLEVANAMGCDPIIFVGMDLAFTGLKAYAPGVVENAAVQKEAILQADKYDDAAILKTDVFGEPIYTLWKWVAEANWIGDFAKRYPNLTVINSTEGGIGFPDIPNMPLAESVKKYLKKNYDLRGRVMGEIQSSPLPSVKKEKIVELIQEMEASLKRCIEDLTILIEEGDGVKEKLKKNPEQPLQTGRAALFESDLAEEVAYQYILEIFNEASSRILNREFRALSLIKSEKQKKMKRIEINKIRLAFLRDVASANLELIKRAFEEVP